jgi:hypothetical protein
VNFYGNIFGNVFKSKYCEMNKQSILHIAIGTYNPRKLAKGGQHTQKQSLLH